jgi:hypothetical protein
MAKLPNLNQLNVVVIGMIFIKDKTDETKLETK